jgi:hypothetical protein
MCFCLPHFIFSAPSASSVLLEFYVTQDMAITHYIHLTLTLTHLKTAKDRLELFLQVKTHKVNASLKMMFYFSSSSI